MPRARSGCARKDKTELFFLDNRSGICFLMEQNVKYVMATASTQAVT